VQVEIKVSTGAGTCSSVMQDHISRDLGVEMVALLGGIRGWKLGIMLCDPNRKAACGGGAAWPVIDLQLTPVAYVGLQQELKHKGRP
jgi:hypothetical protein